MTKSGVKPPSNVTQMTWRRATTGDFELLVRLNRRLQADEGAAVMTVHAIRERLARWLDGNYRAVVFETGGVTVAYALYRETDPDREGPGGIYLRQFFVHPEQRLQGYGRRAFQILSTEVWPSGTRIILEVLVSNPAGQAFWASLGFAPYSVTYQRMPDGP